MKTNNISPCICNVYDEEEINSDFRKKLLLPSTSKQCQFDNFLKPDYQFKGKNYCILHFPFDQKQANNLLDLASEKFYEILHKGETNFNFINAANIKISIVAFPTGSLSFIGSNLWSINITDGTYINDLNLEYCLLRGTNSIRNCKIDQLFLSNSYIAGHLGIINSNIDHAIIKRNIFDSGLKTIRLDENYGIILKNSSFNLFRFIDNNCGLNLDFANTEIQELDLRDTCFYLCPSFFNTNFSDNRNRIILPKLKQFNINELRKRYRVFNDLKSLKTIFKLKKILSSYKRLKKAKTTAMYDQYFKFREIYTITQKRCMYNEQGQYFYLMSRCLELSGKHFNWWYRQISRLYRLSSCYGQSLSRPLIFLTLTWLSFGVLYALPVFLKNSYISLDYLKCSFLLSAQQIVKPYQLFLDKNFSFYFYLFGVLESTISISCLAIFLIALRWNFKRD